MIKQSLIAVLVGATMAACAAPAAKPGDTTFNQVPSYPGIKTIPSPTKLMDNDKPITLEKIMSHEDWISRKPEGGYWSHDSEHVYYRQKRKGSEVRDWYAVDAEGGNPAKVEMLDQHKMGSRSAVYSKDGRYSAWTFSGDVFVRDLKKGNVLQITRTAARESSPMFMNDDSVAYRVGDDYFVWQRDTGTTNQLFSLKMAAKPKGLKDPSSYIAKEQHKLIGFVSLTHKNAKDREAQSKALKAANQSLFNQTFYLGKDNNVVDLSVSPNGKWAVVALQKDVSWRSDSDIMPNYVTQSGGIDPQPARRRVGDDKPQHQTIVVLDLVKNTHHELSFESLPDWDKDVLKAVREENHAREGKQYESKKEARAIGIISYNAMKFNSSGDKLAVMLEATWDNKDRWIATVDYGKNELVSRHQYHDDAWVNYSMNDFGWYNNSDFLYYLSEESGFSHLYVMDEKGNHRALTSGKWEASSPTISANDQYIYFTANKKHPGIYETYKVTTMGGEITQLTDLNGRNDYTLSPDGKKLLIVHSEIAMPPELYVQAIGDNAKAKRVTYTVTDEFLSYNWNVPAIVPVKSSESVDPIFTKVYYPKDHMSGPKRKAVVFVHGAGYTQNSHTGWAYYFHEFLFHSLLAQKGYVVIDMDYRASRGYGRDWRTWIYRQMGTPELQDLKDGVKWMVANANVDEKRIGVYGGSYGGFMTLMSLFKAPELFQAGAALRLVSDWAHYNTGYTANILNTPNDDTIAYERSSPIYFAEGLNKPLLINAPMLDDNVFFQDTVRLVQRMIELKKENFETAIYPVEPHGFVQPTSWLDEYRRIFKLFEQHL